MCRMIAAPLGFPGHSLVGPFVRMAAGLNSTNEVNPSLGTTTHGDGWGVVLQVDREDQRLRSALPCWGHGATDVLRNKPVLLLHARRASRGPVVEDNVHPFQAVVAGQRWSFCHNGTVAQDLEIPATLNKKDCTDSEIVFHQLLPYLNVDPLQGFRDVYGAIEDFTCLNTFLLGPEALWVVCYYTTTPNYFTLHLSTSNHGPVISSEPLEELDTDATMANRCIIRADRMSGRIDQFAL